jgi:putative acetyltransferase
MTVVIAPFKAEHAAAFDALNRQWLVDNGLLEEADEPSLRDPQGLIIDSGGAIFVALEGDAVLGTCAIAPLELQDGARADIYELVKLAVAPSAQGQGIGRRLVQQCIDAARQRGASELVLLSSSLLQAALRLYEQEGFRYAALPRHNPYATADVYMVKKLTNDE